jgi:hypothetical protein
VTARLIRDDRAWSYPGGGTCRLLVWQGDDFRLAIVSGVPSDAGWGDIHAAVTAQTDATYIAELDDEWGWTEVLATGGSGTTPEQVAAMLGTTGAALLALLEAR